MKTWTILGIRRQTTKYANTFNCTAYLHADIDALGNIRYWEISEWNDELSEYPLIYTAHPKKASR